MTEVTARPWYRHRWPWLLMLPPLASVVGGAYTVYLAVSSPDPLVRPDCVRDGVTMRCGDDRAAIARVGPGVESRRTP